MRQITPDNIRDWTVDITGRAKESGNLEGEILKFASEKNLPPAAVEAIAHKYNNAKVKNYIDKTANDKGASFPMLDPKGLLKQYEESDIETSDSKKAHRSVYDDPEYFSTDRFAEAAPGNFVVMPMEEASETQVKEASEEDRAIREIYQKNIARHNLGVVRDLIDEQREEIIKAAGDLASRHWHSFDGLDFAALERDFLYAGEENAKEAADVLASTLEEAHRIRWERPKDTGPRRLVKSASADLEPFERTRMALLRVKVASEKAAEIGGAFFGSGNTSTSTSPARVSVRPENDPADFDDDYRDKIRAELAKEFDTEPEQKAPAKPDGGSGDKGGGKGKKPPPAPGKLTSDTASELDKWLGKSAPTGPSKQQLEYDREMDAGEGGAVAHQLLADDVLSGEDPEKVMEAYNTFRKLAPELSKDPAIARVAVRQMVQYEGVDPQTAKSYAEAEGEHQKVRRGPEQQSKKPEPAGNKS